MQYQINDPSNMYEAIYQFSDHMETAMGIGETINLNHSYGEIRNIIVAGMGGSAIGGDVVRLLTKNELKIPLSVSRHYHVPHWVDEHTLVICSSYSGNTEESLSAYEDAKTKGAIIFGISTGGTLTDILKKDGWDVVTIPGGLQPRAALAFSFVPMMYVLNKLRLIGGDLIQDLSNGATALKMIRDEYASEDESNPAYVLAQGIYQTLPILYGETDSTGIVANRWKGQLSENAKMLAYFNELPELDHNEIVGWENNVELMKKISLLWLVDEDDHPRVSIRQQSTREIIENLPAAHYTIHGEGVSKTERVLQLIHYGDWVSFWCAILHETDPSPVKKIDRLKEILANQD